MLRRKLSRRSLIGGCRTFCKLPHRNLCHRVLIAGSLTLREVCFRKLFHRSLIGGCRTFRKLSHSKLSRRGLIVGRLTVREVCLPSLAAGHQTVHKLSHPDLIVGRLTARAVCLRSLAVGDLTVHAVILEGAHTTAMARVGRDADRDQANNILPDPNQY